MKKVYTFLFTLLAVLAVPATAVADLITDGNALIDKIPTSGAIVTLGILVLEAAFRLLKTEKPKSVIYMIADLIKLIGKGLTKVGELLDKILPQRLK